jgi:hydrogenase expression/formation protein HypE
MKDKEKYGQGFPMSCPVPIQDYEKVLLAHGGGGRLTHQLIEKLFLPELRNPYIDLLHDGAILPSPGQQIAFSTDSYVVQPIFFPGGNIGELAIYGTVNDLACCGAKPMYVSLALIIEEGLEMTVLWEIVRSIRQAAERAGVLVVTGDTKVVDRGKGDRIFINTSGIGWIPEGVHISPKNCQPGDKILLSGAIAEHGIAILSSRTGLAFETEIRSDMAPLNGLVDALLQQSKNIRVLRDPTRGGLAGALYEIACSSGYRIRIEENAIPVDEPVRGACEILGLDPMYIANEGKLIAIVTPEEADRLLETMKKHPMGKRASLIGEVTKEKKPPVQMITSIGTSRIIDQISGEQLPRIC